MRFLRVGRAFLVDVGVDLVGGLVTKARIRAREGTLRQRGLDRDLIFCSRCTINIELHPRIAKPAMATSEVAARRPCPVRAPTLSLRHLLPTLLQPAVLRFNLIWLPPRDRRNNSHLRNNRRKLRHNHLNHHHHNSSSLSPIKIFSSSYSSNR